MKRHDGRVLWGLALGASSLACGEGGQSAGGAREAGVDPAGDVQSDARVELADAGSSRKPFDVQWDLRYDSAGFFSAAECRALLDTAAGEWASFLRDDFPVVPRGTPVLTRNPEMPSVAGVTFPIEYEIDDLAIFVGSSVEQPGSLAGSRPTAAIGSVTDLLLAAVLDERFHGPEFMPWTGWMSIDRAEVWFCDRSPETGDDVPSDEFDLLSVVLHETGHVLGIGTSHAFKSLVDANGRFIGPHAVEAYGKPVPLTSDGMHIGEGVLSDGRAPVMDQFDSPGQRSRVTRLDLAMLEDIGYHVVLP